MQEKKDVMYKLKHQRKRKMAYSSKQRKLQETADQHGLHANLYAIRECQHGSVREGVKRNY
jgi:hypothetical protein